MRLGFVTLMLLLAGKLSGAGCLGLFEGPEEGRSPAGAWWAAFIGHVVLAVVYALFFQIGAWKRKDIGRHGRGRS